MPKDEERTAAVAAPPGEGGFAMHAVLPEPSPAADGGVPEAGLEALIGTLTAYNPRADVERIRAAHAYAAKAHAGQKRRSGEPYITHPVAVAGILARQRMDDDTIVTALLHDTVEDTSSTNAEIARRFGAQVAEMVEGVTKLTEIQLTGQATEQAENFRKLFFAMSRDLRVIVVKLADRLHNMRTLRAMPSQKQEKKARETMEIYAPLAGRMGMQTVREELEDLAFEVLEPGGRVAVLRRIAELKRRQGAVDRAIAADIEALMAREGIEATVSGRAKRPYSIWRKMQEKDLLFEQLSDIWGFRVIARTEADCYRALGAIHGRWKAVPGRFKDYISNPKTNGYRSIHTTVSGRRAERVEVQIRTREMHEVAESGVAAHWAYRDGAPGQNRFAVEPTRWVEEMAARFGGEGQGGDEAAFLEHMKLELYTDQVFCFTPKGDVVQLPKGATPLDFAYAIHTRVGDHFVMAKVNGQRVPLFTALRNGDSVEIVTAAGQRPQAGWLEDVKTGRAKAAIRRSIRAHDREKHVAFGRELARAAFEVAGLSATDRALGVAAERLGLPSVEEMLARIGTAELNATDAAATLAPQAATGAPVAAQPVLGLAPGQVPVRGTCCQPLPGERIIGVTFRGEGVVLHAADCAALAAVEDQPERWVDARWSPGAHPPEHAVTLELVIANAAGVLGRVCTAIGRQGANISNLVFEGRKPDYFRLRLDAEFSDAEHLHRVVAALQALPDVASVRRHRGAPEAEARAPEPAAAPAAE